MTDNFDPNITPGTEPVPEIPEIPQPAAPYTDPFQGQQPPQAPVPPQPEYQQQAPYGQAPYQAQPQYQQAPQGYPQYPQYPQQPQQVRYEEPPQGYQQKSRLAAALLGILLGVFGVHNYYLGFKTKFIIQILLGTVGALLCGIGPMVSSIWGLIEGILLLLASDQNKLYDGNGVRLKD